MTKKRCIMVKGMLTAFLLFSMIKPGKAQGDHPDTLLVFHPTVGTITTIEYLRSQQLLDVDNIFFLGVYHARERYDYTSSRSLISSSEDLPWALREVSADLSGGEFTVDDETYEVYRMLFSNSCGALLPGGPDIPPSLYGEKINLLTEVSDPWRHYLEATYLFTVLGGSQDATYRGMASENPAYAIIGICLGMQTINVATGGTLIQDIPTELYNQHTRESIFAATASEVHRNYAYDDPSDTIQLTGYHLHPIHPVDNLWLAGLCDRSQPNPWVLSSHHQAIEALGRGLYAAAYSMDGKIIEAVGHDRYPNVLGVQFHPEYTAIYDHDLASYRNPAERFRFNQEISDTHDSMRFHMAYWKKISATIEDACGKK